MAIAYTSCSGSMLGSDDPAQHEAAGRVAVFRPDQAGPGTHVNVSGGGVTRAARNAANAIRLLEYMACEDAQRWYAETNSEYPVRPGVAWSATLRRWGPFTSDRLALARLAHL